MIVVPPTLIDYWIYELTRWSKGTNMQIISLYGNKQKRRKNLPQSAISKYVAVLSPNTLITDFEYLCQRVKWDIMVIDEGHKAKNLHTKLR